MLRGSELLVVTVKAETCHGTDDPEKHWELRLAEVGQRPTGDERRDGQNRPTRRMTITD
jgi:hypothetical protein